MIKDGLPPPPPTVCVRGSALAAGRAACLGSARPRCPRRHAHAQAQLIPSGIGAAAVHAPPVAAQHAPAVRGAQGASRPGRPARQRRQATTRRRARCTHARRYVRDACVTSHSPSPRPCRAAAGGIRADGAVQPPCTIRARARRWAAGHVGGGGAAPVATWPGARAVRQGDVGAVPARSFSGSAKHPTVGPITAGGGVIFCASRVKEQAAFQTAHKAQGSVPKTQYV